MSCSSLTNDKVLGEGHNFVSNINCLADEFNTRRAEEYLREACSLGSLKSVKKFLEAGVNVNSKNPVNGWTALHWASKRNYTEVVEYLLLHGANPSVTSNDGCTPAKLTESKDILNLLSGSSECVQKSKPSITLPIIPNYLGHPPLLSDNAVESLQIIKGRERELILKLRVADCDDKDFVEIEVSPTNLSYDKLIKICCEELVIDMHKVFRLRKLPNTIVRNDKDIKRLENLQELEVVLKSP